MGRLCKKSKIHQTTVWVFYQHVDIVKLPFFYSLSYVTPVLGLGMKINEHLLDLEQPLIGKSPTIWYRLSRSINSALRFGYGKQFNWLIVPVLIDEVFS
jgi:hypothetical protein